MAATGQKKKEKRDTARPAPSRSARTVFTIGHSNRSADELLALLRAHGVEQLIDVRRFPRSRSNPQFNRETFGPWLRSRRINYRHMKSLGGRKAGTKESPNTGWRNSSFRAYADYMQTAEFQEGLEKLLSRAREKVVAIMCAEAVPWRCHRSLIADSLTVRGMEVRNIMTAKSAPVHRLNRMARVRRGTIFYLPVDDEPRAASWEQRA